MKVAVIGAGPAGMTAAYQLARAGVEVDVYEASDTVGGMARSFSLWGQTVDLGPHRFFSNDARVNRLWLEVVGQDYRMVNRLTRIYYNHRFFYYPLQPVNALWNMGLWEAARCITSYLRERARSSVPANAPETFESWVVGRFGRRLFEMFFQSYSEKLWGISCQDLDADFAAQRIKRFSLGEAIKSALGAGGNKHKTLVDCFAYPLGGTGMVYERMADFIRSRGGRVHLRRPIRRVLQVDGQVVGVEWDGGERDFCNHVISTMPLTLLVKSLGDLPEEVEQAIDSLTFRNTILVYLNVAGTDLFPDQWLYIHSPGLKMGRVTNFRNWIPDLYGEQRSSILALEYWCYDHDDLWLAPEEELIHLASQEIRSTGLIGKVPILDGKVVRVRRCYPVYRAGYRQHVSRIRSHVQQFQGLTPIGRYGSFKYNNQDHSILMGLLATENLLEGKSHDLWEVNTDYDSYQEEAHITATGLQLAEEAVA
jgi:protoporphyrinogen oxidase